MKPWLATTTFYSRLWLIEPRQICLSGLFSFSSEKPCLAEEGSLGSQSVHWYVLARGVKKVVVDQSSCTDIVGIGLSPSIQTRWSREYPWPVIMSVRPCPALYSGSYRPLSFLSVTCFDVSRWAEMGAYWILQMSPTASCGIFWWAPPQMIFETRQTAVFRQKAAYLCAFVQWWSFAMILSPVWCCVSVGWCSVNRLVYNYVENDL